MSACLVGEPVAVVSVEPKRPRVSSVSEEIAGVVHIPEVQNLSAPEICEQQVADVDLEPKQNLSVPEICEQQVAGVNLEPNSGPTHVHNVLEEAADSVQMPEVSNFKVDHNCEVRDLEVSENCEPQLVDPEHEIGMETEDGYIMIDKHPNASRKSKRGSRSASRSRKPVAAGDINGAASAAMAAMLFAIASGEASGGDRNLQKTPIPRASSRPASVAKQDNQWLSQQPRGRRSSTTGPRQQHQQHRTSMSRGPRR